MYRFEDVLKLKKKQLDSVFQSGTAPVLDKLAGYEFDGVNTNEITRLLGIKKFIKAFSWDEQYEYYGYNVVVKQNSVLEPHLRVSKKGHSLTQGFFKLKEPSSRYKYKNACVIEYNCSLNARLDVSRLLTDYLVKIDPDNENLLLGKAYIKAWTTTFYVSYFVLKKRGSIGEKVTPRH